VSQRPHETEHIDLNEKVQTVLEVLELDIEEKKAEVYIGNLPAINGYRRQLQQLFQNLISNAIKYSKADVKPKINITADQTKKKRERIPRDFGARQRHWL
jgi:light-regulated signal transduction histidine kinase (bacteriophytochrome)